MEVRDLTVEEFRDFCKKNKGKHLQYSTFIGMKIERLLIIDTWHNHFKVRCDCGREETKPKQTFLHGINFCCSKCTKEPRKQLEDFNHLIGTFIGPMEIINVIQFVKSKSCKKNCWIPQVKTKCSLCGEEALWEYDVLKSRRKCDCQKPVHIGDRFGRLVVTEGPFSVGGYQEWLCKCDCGNTRRVRTTNLANNTTKSCGCMSGVNDITGMVFGLSTVISFDHLDEKGSFWKVRCTCGVEEILNRQQIMARNKSTYCIHNGIPDWAKEATSDKRKSKSVQKSLAKYSSQIQAGNLFYLEDNHKWKTRCSLCGKFFVVNYKTNPTTYQCPHCIEYRRGSKSLQRTKQNQTDKGIKDIGKRFGRLIVMGMLSGRKSREGNSKFDSWCLCDCGKVTVTKLCDLHLGRVSSCGCLRSNTVSARQKQAGVHNYKKAPWKYLVKEDGTREILPKYSSWAEKLGWAEEVRPDPNHKYLLEVKCAYCGKWFTPTLDQVKLRHRALNGTTDGELRLYCSSGCKRLCPIFGQLNKPKQTKVQDYVREVQPELRQLVFERDDYECQKCGSKKYLNCHHYTGVVQNPVESADIDNCVTLCLKCHKEAHKDKGCRYYDLRCA